MKLCAIVVTYYPDVEETTENIMNYLPLIDKLIIWENTPKKDLNKYKIKIAESISESNKIIYNGTGDNVGISKALNWAVDYALKNGFTHLLTMDQDSIWSNFRKYRDEIELSAGQLSFYVPLINGNINSKNNVHITSGMIVPTDVYKKVGGYCEEFKIDVVDYEFCIRCSTYGIFPKIIKEANLIQKFGIPDVKSIFGHNIICSNYNPERLFNIVKNYTILIKSYDICLTEKWNLIKFWILKTPLKIILFEKHKLNKIWAIMSGLVSGMGHTRLNTLKH